MFTRFLSQLGRVAPYVIPFLVGCIIALVIFRSTFHTPYNSNGQPTSFLVEKGDNLTTIAKKLEEEGFIGWWRSVSLAGRMRSGDQKGDVLLIQVGEYMLSSAMTPVEIVEKLLKGDIVYHTMTVPEGTRLSEIASLMAKTGLVIIPDAERALQSKELMAKLAIPNSFEGYLFPETYKFSRPITADDMVERMVLEGKKRIPPEYYDRAIELGLSFPQVLTLASIIEKETGKAEERPTISSVFHNRLSIQMPLQSDPTVIYCIPDFNGNITAEDLRIPCPYNTYLNTGLPPTPICNPGLESIKAALYPAQTDFLYFVARCDKSHQFSTTYREHREAVELYQKTACPPTT